MKEANGVHNKGAQPTWHLEKGVICWSSQLRLERAGLLQTPRVPKVI